jgi:Ca2+-binding RTX toxin-like protein
MAENAYINMYGDFDFSTEESLNNSNVDSYLISTDNFGSVLMDNIEMDVEDLIDDPNALKEKWLRQSNEIIGTSAKDKIDAYEGNDIIFGGAGKDKITGGNGNDYLDGGGDNDILKGNSGEDTFVVRYNGSVIIKDFNVDDDFIKIQGASLSDISIERSKRFTYIEDGEGYWIAKLNGAPDLSNAVFL